MCATRKATTTTPKRATIDNASRRVRYVRNIEIEGAIEQANARAAR
jgi:hypothetical protein